jgi:hypothetical protein
MTSPVTTMASSLAEIFNDEKDKTLAQHLFELRSYQKNVDTQEYQNVAKMIAEFALSQTGESETQRELEYASLRLAGLTHGGRSLLTKEQQESVLKKFIPRAMGESPEASFYSEPVSQLLLRHLNPQDKYPIFPKEVKGYLDQYLDKEKAQWLIERVESQSIESPFDEVDEMGNVDPIKDIKKSFGLNEDEPAPKPADNVAKLSSDAAEEVSRSAQLAERVDRDATKNRIDMEMRVDAQNRINEIFAKDENSGWAEKNVWSKLKGKVGEGVDRVFLQDPIKYPKESLFSQTLVDLDPQTLLTRRELLKFKALGSFKATFPSSKVSDDVYNYAALSALSQGIVYPYIKSTFTDPNEAYTFLEKMTKSLVEAGYDIDSIRVSPHLLKFFEERIKPGYSQENALEEAPEVAIDNPEVTPEELKNNLGDGPVEPFRHVATRFNPELESSIEHIKEKINEINSHPLKIGSSLFDSEVPKSISDLEKEDILEIYKLAPFLSLPDEGWNNISDGAGLAPGARKVVEKVSSYIDKIANKAIPDENGVVKMDPEKHSNQHELLKSARPLISDSNPELAKKVADALALFERPKADSDGFVIPDSLWLRKPNESNSTDEYAAAMSKQAIYDWENLVKEAKVNYLKSLSETPSVSVDTIDDVEKSSPVEVGNPELNTEDPEGDAKERAPESFFYDEVPPHMSEIPPPSEELGPPSGEPMDAMDSFSEDIPPIPPEVMENQKAEVAAPIPDEPSEVEVASPYLNEAVVALSKSSAAKDLDGDAIKVAAQMSQSDVDFFNSNPPSKEEMTGTEFSNLRRNLREIRDAVNPFQESPSELQLEIIAKVPHDVLVDIMPEKGLEALANLDVSAPSSGINEVDGIEDFSSDALPQEMDLPPLMDEVIPLDMEMPGPVPPDMDIPPLDAYDDDISNSNNNDDEQTSFRRGR